MFERKRKVCVSCLKTLKNTKRKQSVNWFRNRQRICMFAKEQQVHKKIFFFLDKELEETK